jgi:hypothetical protein
MKRPKFAAVTAALLTRREVACPWDDHLAAATAPETADSPSNSFGPEVTNVAIDKPARPLFPIATAPAKRLNGKLPLSQSDYERLGRLIVDKLNITNITNDRGAGDGTHFVTGGSETEIAPLVSQRAWLKMIWTGFQALGLGPRL